MFLAELPRLSQFSVGLDFVKNEGLQRKIPPLFVRKEGPSSLFVCLCVIIQKLEELFHLKLYFRVRKLEQYILMYIIFQGKVYNSV